MNRELFVCDYDEGIPVFFLTSLSHCCHVALFLGKKREELLDVYMRR